MRAAQIAELKSPPRAAELDDVAGVEILAVALNPLDRSVADGLFYGGHPPLPGVPGCEAVARADDGGLVYLAGEGRGTARNGFMAERVAVGRHCRSDSRTASLRHSPPLPASLDSPPGCRLRGRRRCTTATGCSS